VLSELNLNTASVEEAAPNTSAIMIKSVYVLGIDENVTEVVDPDVVVVAIGSYVAAIRI
jgi:hypothetical protein